MDKDISKNHDFDLIEKTFPPMGEIPEFDVPRFWSNSQLISSETIIALVLSKPTVADLARTVVSYGPRQVFSVLQKLEDISELSPIRLASARDMLVPVIEGVADAAREVASA